VNVRIRRLRDMRIVRTVGTLPSEADISCRDAAGETLLVLDTDHGEPRARHRLLRVTGRRRRTIHRGTAQSASFTGGRVFLEEGWWGRDLVEVDARTGREKPIARTVPLPGGWTMSPDGRRLATVNYDGDQAIEGALATSVVVVTLGARPRVVRSPTRQAYGQVVWLSASRLLYGSQGAHLALYDARARRLRAWRTATNSRYFVPLGDRLFAFDEGRLELVDPGNGRVTQAGELPSPQTYGLTALPGRPEIALPQATPLVRRVVRLCLELF
jgi:hypothetical protein